LDEHVTAIHIERLSPMGRVDWSAVAALAAVAAALAAVAGVVLVASQLREQAQLTQNPSAATGHRRRWNASRNSVMLATVSARALIGADLVSVVAAVVKPHFIGPMRSSAPSLAITSTF